MADHILDYSGLDYYTRRIKEELSEKLESYQKLAGLTKVFVYKGSVDNYEDLPTEGLEIGHVYNVVNAYPDKKIKAGDNVCWNGEDWDDLAGSVDTSDLLSLADAAGMKDEVQAAIDAIKDKLGSYIVKNDVDEVIGEYLTWEELLASFEVVTDEEVRALFPSEDGANLLVTGDLNIDDAFDVDGNVWVNGNITGEGTLTSTGWINATGTISATIKQNATLTSPHISISNGQTQFQGDSSVSNGTCSVGGTGVSNNATCVVNCDMEIDGCSVIGTTLYNYGYFIANGKLSIPTWEKTTDPLTFPSCIINYKTLELANNVEIQTTTLSATQAVYIYNQLNGELILNNNITLTFTYSGLGWDIRSIGIENNNLITVNGNVNIIQTTGTVIYNSGTISGTGTITVNGDPYDF